MKRILLATLTVFVGALVFQASVARAEYCYNGPNRPQIGTTGDVFWGNPPPPYSDITLSAGMIARMSLEGTFPLDETPARQDCEGETITVQIFPDGNPAAVAATVSGNLVSGSGIQGGNSGSWQWYVDWPHNLFNGRYRYRVIAINGFAVSGVVSSNVLTIVGSTSAPFVCSVTPVPASGIQPVNGVDMTLSVVSGWQDASRWRVDCTDNGSYDEPWFQVTTVPTWTWPDLCNYPIAGNYTIRARVEEQGASSGRITECTTTIVVSPPPPPIPDILCNGANSCTIAYNASANLSWTSPNATSCALDANGVPTGWTGTNQPNVPTGNLTGTVTYNLVCSGPGGSITDSVTVTVGAPPPTTADIRCNNLDSCTIAYNTSANLSWTSNATSCALDANGVPTGWTGTNQPNVPTGNLTGTVTYNLVCSGPGGNQPDSVTVNVSPPPPTTADIRCNNLDACSIAYNTSANLSWTSTSATSCSVSPGGWTETNTTSPHTTGNLTTTTTYNLSCTGPGGNQPDSVTVTVGAPPPPPPSTASITCNGIAGTCGIVYGGTANINWLCGNSTTGSVTNSADATVLPNTSGTYTTGSLNSNVTFTLNCSGLGTPANSSVTVNVGPPPTPTPGPAPLAINFFQLNIPNPFSGDIDTLEELFNAAITFLYFVAGPIVVIMIILSGLFFLFARDQADKINTAKRILLYALVGFSVILIGRGFIALIESILALGG